MYSKIVKPILDIVIAFGVCIVMTPIFLIIAFLIKIDDGGAVFYRAKRLGQNGRPFNMYKFRSMQENAPDIRNEDGTTYSAADDPRLTKIGKKLREYSIDELPQFYNVLKGEMSILGPRPDPLEWYEINTGEMNRKYSVKPGISGYTQAYYRNTLPLKEKNKSDLYYADNVSFMLDIKIFFKTLTTVFNHDNLYRNSDVVEFSGAESEVDYAEYSKGDSE